MSDSNPGPSTPGDEPEYLEPIAGSPLPRSVSVAGPPRSGRRGVVLGAGLGVVALAGAGAWAASMYFATGEQPTAALPASTLAYVSIDVEPSGEQQVEAYRFLRKFPAIRAELNLDDDTDLRAELFSWVKEQGGCDSVDFANDVEPWLGTTAAVAAIDLGGDEITPVLVVQVTDEEAAGTGLAALRDCGGANEVGGWSIADGWAVVAEDAATADRVVAAATADPLSEDADHTAWIDEVGDLGILTMYAGPDALPRLMESADAQLQDPALDDLSDLYADFTGMAGTLRFADAGLEFEAVTAAQQNGEDVLGASAGASMAALPADTAAAVGLSVGDGYAAQVEKQLASWAGGGMSEDDIEGFEMQTGLDFPADVETLLGDAFVVAVSGDLDIEAIANSSDGSDVPIGVKITGDTPAIEAVLEKLRTTLGPYGEPFLASDSAGDVVAIGPSADYRAALLADGGLGDSDAFTDVVGNVDDAGAVAFVDFGDWLDRLIAGSGDPDMANLEPLKSLGATGTVDGDIARMTLRISTD